MCIVYCCCIINYLVSRFVFELLKEKNNNTFHCILAGLVDKQGVCDETKTLIFAAIFLMRGDFMSSRLTLQPSSDSLTSVLNAIINKNLNQRILISEPKEPVKVNVYTTNKV